jgi:concentrative nucleoside transporter, CNT family
MSSWWLNGLSFVGIFALCGIAWLTSENRRVIPWKTIIWGIGLQLILGLLVFLVPQTRLLVALINDAVNTVLDATEEGARFIFGSLLVPNPASSAPGPILAGRWIARAITPSYVPVPGDRLSPDNLNVGYIFAFRALPSVIFFSALMSLLYALGLIQPIVNLFSQIFRRTMNLSGAESLSGSANIFVGIEALLVVRPYLAKMTRSELCAILASCFGSIASTVLAVYAVSLRPVFPNITGHLVSASIMAIPACFVISKILVPETEIPQTMGLTLRERVVMSEGRKQRAEGRGLEAEGKRLEATDHERRDAIDRVSQSAAEDPTDAVDFAAQESTKEDRRDAIYPASQQKAEETKNAENLEKEKNQLDAEAAYSSQKEESSQKEQEAIALPPPPPQTLPQQTVAALEPIQPEVEALNPMESVVVGALDGVKLAAAIAALLIAVLGLVALVNLFFANLASLANSSQPAIQSVGKLFQVITLENIFGTLFVPFAFLMGVPLPDVWRAALLLGQRLLVTEIPAYQQLAVLSSEGAISDRTLLIVSYALCGFAHIPSLGIFVGGLTGLVPSRRKDIAELGWKALWAATLATLMIGCIAGLYDTGNAGVLGK